MSRYIDADALDRAFSKLRFNTDGELEHYGDRPNWYLWGSEVENLIADAPTIDIVRCKECRWLDKGENESCSWSMCTRHFGQYINVNTDDFCSYGERSSDEQ